MCDVMLCLDNVKPYSVKKGEASWDDQPSPGSHLRDCGEHPLCKGVWLGGGDGDDH